MRQTCLRHSCSRAMVPGLHVGGAGAFITAKGRQIDSGRLRTGLSRAGKGATAFSGRQGGILRMEAAWMQPCFRCSRKLHCREPGHYCGSGRPRWRHATPRPFAADRACGLRMSRWRMRSAVFKNETLVMIGLTTDDPPALSLSFATKGIPGPQLVGNSRFAVTAAKFQAREDFHLMPLTRFLGRPSLGVDNAQRRKLSGYCSASCLTKSFPPGAEPGRTAIINHAR